MLISWLFVIGFVAGIVGLVLSVVGMRQAKQRNAPNGLAIAGLTCSIIAVVVGLVVTVVVIVAFDTAY